MEIRLNIPDYNGHSLESTWEENFNIRTSVNANEIILSANKAGLISLAKQLLTLAQDEYKIGSHFHYDDFNSLESGSEQLIIEKI